MKRFTKKIIAGVLASVVLAGVTPTVEKNRNLPLFMRKMHHIGIRRKDGHTMGKVLHRYVILHPMP